jgi:hypothetical protein
MLIVNFVFIIVVIFLFTLTEITRANSHNNIFFVHFMQSNWCYILLQPDLYLNIFMLIPVNMNVYRENFQPFATIDFSKLWNITTIIYWIYEIWWHCLHTVVSFTQVKVTLWPTVSLGVSTPSGTRDQFFFLLAIFFRQLWHHRQISQSQSHITTDGQSASSSWCLAPFGSGLQMLHLFEWLTN